MIKYIGSKRQLLPHLVRTIGGLPDVRTALDVFSGTSRVGHALKSAGLRVHANDHNRYAATLARCYVAADAEQVLANATRILAELQDTPPSPGYFTATFCEAARYVHPKNGARIDAIRDRIAAMGLEPNLEAVVLTALVEAADRVDSTTGVQMAYLKKWAPRALNDLELRVPKVLPGTGVATELDALDCVSRHEADVIYLDPPYNQHSYLGNYHVWETLVRWDAPETYGIACKRVDCKERRSPFNSKPGIAPALEEVIKRCQCRYLVVSFSNEGFVDREQMIGMLEQLGEVEVASIDYDRYVGAKIGIHNPKGERVGRVSHTRNVEHVYVVRR